MTLKSPINLPVERQGGSLIIRIPKYLRDMFHIKYGCNVPVDLGNAECSDVKLSISEAVVKEKPKSFEKRLVALREKENKQKRKKEK